MIRSLKFTRAFSTKRDVYSLLQPLCSLGQGVNDFVYNAQDLYRKYAYICNKHFLF